MKINKGYILMLMLALSVVFLAACTQTKEIVRDIPQPMDENPSTTVQEISVKAVLGTFSPEQITVKKGIPVKLTITSTEIDPKFQSHGFAIKELGIDEKIGMNETKIVEFTPAKTGSFVYYCSVYCGQGHIGQTGILHVVE